jgi:predicted RNA-binding protein YlxR (DUF448 family)
LKGKTVTLPDPELDCLEAGDGDPPQSGPLRRCLVTRKSFLRETMLRFVLAPGDEIVFDVLATLPGRGMWLSADGDVVEQGIKRGVFARAAKASVRIPADLRKRIEASLLHRTIELLGLARRSGNAISGFEKAREWLVSGRTGLVVQASDGSAEERARFVGGRNVPVVAVLSAAALGKVFGREHAVHVAIASGKLARMIEVEAARFAGVAGKGTSGQ